MSAFYILLSASGMASGGRVLHHLKAFAPEARNLILFTGYQAAGTRGAAMLAGSDTVKIHGQWVPVRAEVLQLHATSSHADYRELLAWITASPRVPRRIFVTHGEPAASDALRQHLRRALDVEVTCRSRVRHSRRADCSYTTRENRWGSAASVLGAR